MLLMFHLPLPLLELLKAPLLLLLLLLTLATRSSSQK